MQVDTTQRELRLVEFYRLAARMQSIPGFGYGFSLLCFVVACLVRYASADYLPVGFPFLTFFPAVILSSVFGGARGGLLCSALSLLAAWYLFIPPYYSFAMEGPTLLALAYFAVVTVVDVLIITWLNRSIAALEIEKEKNRLLAEERLVMARQQKALFQELQHRTANNLAMVASLLSISQRKLKHIPEAVDVMQDARLRIDQMSRVHRRLYDPSTDAVRLHRYFEDLCKDLLVTGGVDSPDVQVDCDPLELSVQQLTNLSMIVLEALMNAIKHARRRDDHLRIGLTLKKGEDGYATMTIVDNGPGYAPDFDPSTSRQLGFKLIQSFAEALRGQAQFLNRGGALVSVTFRPCEGVHSFE